MHSLDTQAEEPSTSCCCALKQPHQEKHHQYNGIPTETYEFLYSQFPKNSEHLGYTVGNMTENLGKKQKDKKTSKPMATR